jgi:hypothetical protein
MPAKPAPLPGTLVFARTPARTQKTTREAAMPSGNSVQQTGISKKPSPGGIEETTPVAVTVAFGETELRQRVKQAGGKWDRERKVWLLPYGIARKLWLHGRIRKLRG